MSKVDSDHSTCLHAYHEIVQMSVSNAQNPVANAHKSMRAGKVGAKRQEGLRACAHLQKGPPEGGRHDLCSLCYTTNWFVQSKGYLL